MIDYNLNQTRRSKSDNSSIESVSDQDTPLSITNRSSPQTATASIFAPRTEDMNKGFLTFSEDQPGLTSKYFGIHHYYLSSLTIIFFFHLFSAKR